MTHECRRRALADNDALCKYYSAMCIIFACISQPQHSLYNSAIKVRRSFALGIPLVHLRLSVSPLSLSFSLSLSLSLAHSFYVMF